MNLILALPVLLPLLTASIMLMLWRKRRAQRWISLCNMIAMCIASIVLLTMVYQHGIASVQMGGYVAPYGITFVADLFSAIMVCATSVMGLLVAVYSLTDINKRRETFGYHPLLNLLLMGVCGAFLTGDMFNLYVFFEIMLMASFVLLTLGGERGQMEGAIKYVTLNLISSAFFLAGVGLLYGLTGTLNMADLAVKVQQIDRATLTAVSMLFLVAFGVKAAMFPLFFWLPASYHTPPPAVSAIFAALLTKVGVYSLMRVFTLIFVHDPAVTHMLILVAAGFGMVCGVLGAAAQNEFRRILAFHSVSQIGYMLMGLGLFAILATSQGEHTRLIVQTALAGTIIFVVHHLIVKPNLFLISGVVERLSGTGKLKDLGGFYTAMPALSVMFLITSLSLAGIPPLSGFWAKYILVRAALGLEFYIIAAAALFTGLLTLFSMVKIWAAVFWAPAPDKSLLSDAERARASRGLNEMLIPITVLAVMIVIFGFAAGPVFDVAMQAAEQLMTPSMYIDAVFDGRDVLDATSHYIDGDATP
jgi:multicomponent Na+:H+ antiporter subunit D